jgi:hypothetical protein
MLEAKAMRKEDSKVTESSLLWECRKGKKVQIPNSIYKLISHLTENTFQPHYKYQLVTLYREINVIYLPSQWTSAQFWIVIKWLLHVVTSVLSLYNGTPQRCIAVHAFPYPSKQYHRYVNFCTCGSSNTSCIRNRKGCGRKRTTPNYEIL